MIQEPNFLFYSIFSGIKRFFLFIYYFCFYAFLTISFTIVLTVIFSLSHVAIDQYYSSSGVESATVLSTYHSVEHYSPETIKIDRFKFSQQVLNEEEYSTIIKVHNQDVNISCPITKEQFEKIDKGTNVNVEFYTGYYSKKISCLNISILN